MRFEGENVFVALEFIPQIYKGIFGEIISILNRPKARLEDATVWGVRFGVIRAPVKNTQPSWEEIAALAGRFADRILLPDGVTPPEDSGIAALHSPRFEKKVLLSTACEIIRLTRMPMYRRVMGIIDLDAEHTDLLYDLLLHYTSVRVVTGNPERYAKAAEEMMDRLGAPVLVGERLSMLSECVLILAPGCGGWPSGDQLPCPVLASEYFGLPRGWDVINRLETTPPQELIDCCPQGITPHRLAGAVFETSNGFSGDYIGRKVLHNGKNADLMEAVRAVIYGANISYLP